MVLIACVGSPTPLQKSCGGGRWKYVDVYVDQLTGSILKKRKKQNWVPHIPSIESLYL